MSTPATILLVVLVLVATHRVASLTKPALATTKRSFPHLTKLFAASAAPSSATIFQGSSLSLNEGSTTATTGNGGDGDDGDDDNEDDALIRRISAEVMLESGVELDQLINPSKVVNLERELISLSKELSGCTSEEERVKVEDKMAKNRAKLSVEKRAVMRGWLKGLFVGQSVLAVGISFAMVYDLFPGMELPLPVRVLGFWMWWLFIVPSLRARKPGALEKDALNIAFIATPAISLALPALTKDVAVIWWANAAVTALCYAYAYNKPGAADGSNKDDDEQSSSLPPILVKAIKALDYGSGRERGERKD